MPNTANEKPGVWETVKKLTIELNEEADADVIRQLESQNSVGEYVKRLIREDAARNVQKPLPGINPEDISNTEKNFDAILSIMKKVISK